MDFHRAVAADRSALRAWALHWNRSRWHWADLPDHAWPNNSASWPWTRLLLRQLRRKTIDTAISPRVLGIDDWAWRKGQRYGKILCDLERGTVVDLLTDRSTESTERWLRSHPETELISRDRASVYAQAATNGAPQAV